MAALYKHIAPKHLGSLARFLESKIGMVEALQNTREEKSKDVRATKITSTKHTSMRRTPYLESDKHNWVSIRVSLDLNPAATKVTRKVGAKALLDLPIVHGFGEASNEESVVSGEVGLGVFFSIIITIVLVVVASGSRVDRDRGKRSTSWEPGGSGLMLHDHVIGPGVKGRDAAFRDFREGARSSYDDERS